MSSENIPATPSDTPTPGEGPGSDSQAVTEAPSHDGSKLHREAARYRLQLRDAEQKIARLQRAEIERLASAGLSTPSDLFTLSGNRLEDYLTDDGEIDPDRVSADVTAILTERPGLKKTSPALDPSLGTGGSVGKRSPSFSDLFQ